MTLREVITFASVARKCGQPITELFVEREQFETLMYEVKTQPPECRWAIDFAALLAGRIVIYNIEIKVRPPL